MESRYAGQRTVYALAALRSGAALVEVAYSFLERPEDVVSTVFTVEDIPAHRRAHAHLKVGRDEGPRLLLPIPEPFELVVERVPCVAVADSRLGSSGYVAATKVAWFEWNEF